MSAEDWSRLLPPLDEKGERAVAALDRLPAGQREAVRALLVRARRRGRVEERTARAQRRRERRTEDNDYARAQVRMMAAAARRAAGDLPALVSLVEMRSYLAELERLAVTGLRAQGYSWAEIGRSLDITRQSAWGRFRRQDEPDGSGVRDD